jgi:hypothetical protein
MTMTAEQVSRLVSQIARDWSLPGLQIAASDLGLAIAGDLNLTEAAIWVISELNSELPPRDRELLMKLEQVAPPGVRTLATELRDPPFFPPSDPHDALMIGKAAFVDREDLRTRLREFSFPTLNSTHVLVVRGEQPCGKSYTWWFLRHLARASGARAPRLDLEARTYTPRELVHDVFQYLSLDLGRLPSMTDDPQLARIEPLMAAFVGQIQVMQGLRYWLVVDGLNSPHATQAVQDTVFALAKAVQENLPDRLWMALLGYNPPIEDPDLRDVIQEDARFPDHECVAAHFERMALLGGYPVTPEQARDLAVAIFEPFRSLDKPAMMALTPLVEKVGERLRMGQYPS